MQMIPKNIKPTSYVFLVKGIVLIFLQIRRRHVCTGMSKQKVRQQLISQKI